MLIYYNIDIYNDPVKNNEKIILAKFDESRTVPLIENPNDYELSIVRFSIPAQNIPILIWPGDDVFKISIEWKGFTASSFLQFSGQGLNVYGLAIYTYQELCDIFNAAFLDIHVQLTNQFPGPLPGTEDWLFYAYKPVKYLYDPNKFIFEIPYETPVTKGNWDTKVLPSDPIQIFFNREMAKLIRGHQFSVNTSDNDKFFKLEVGNNGNNIVLDQDGELVYKLKQEFVTLSSINDLDNIIFRTSKVPVVSEYLGSQTNQTQQILTDFELLQENSFDGSDIQFFPSGPLRYYPLQTNTDFRDIDVQVFWKNREGSEFPLFISPGEKCSIKIQFRKVPAIVFEEVIQQTQMESS